MATDFREIELTDEQKRRIAELAELSGQSWSEVIEEKLGPVESVASAQAHWSLEDRYIEDLEKWRTYFQHWRARRKSYNPSFDDSRESIYPDRI